MLSAFALQAKNAKELIELFEEPIEKNKVCSAKKILNPKLVQNTQTLDASLTKHESKKASDYFQVPVEQKDVGKKTSTSQKKDAAIPVTNLDRPKITSKKQPKKIFVNNEITENMITYHYLGARVPTKLTVSFNDAEPIIVLHNKKIETTHNSPFTLMPGNIFKAKIYYQFDVGGLIYRKGTKEVTYKINTPVEKITTQFSWHKPEKIIIKEAELIAFMDV